MSNRLRKASIVFYILAVITFFCALALLTYDSANGMRLSDMIYVIPHFLINLLRSCWAWLLEERPSYSEERQLWYYTLFMFPVLFASIAVALRTIAKALDAQILEIMNLMNEAKSKQEQK